MRVILDLYPDAQGDWAVEAYDLPELVKLSSTFPSSTAAFTNGETSRQAGSVRLVFTEGLLTPFAERALSAGAATLYVYVYQPLERTRMLEFERGIEPRYQNYYAEYGVLYTGVFDVSGLDGPFLGEILAFDRPLAAAKEFVAQHEPAADIQQIEDECRALQRRDIPRHLFWLTR